MHVSDCVKVEESLFANPRAPKRCVRFLCASLVALAAIYLFLFTVSATLGTRVGIWREASFPTSRPASRLRGRCVTIDALQSQISGRKSRDTVMVVAVGRTAHALETLNIVRECDGCDVYFTQINETSTPVDLPRTVKTIESSCVPNGDGQFVPEVSKLNLTHIHFVYDDNSNLAMDGLTSPAVGHLFSCHTALLQAFVQNKPSVATGSLWFHFRDWKQNEVRATREEETTLDSEDKSEEGMCSVRFRHNHNRDVSIKILEMFVKTYSNLHAINYALVTD